MNRQDLQWRVEYFLFRLIMCLFQILSWKQCVTVARGLATVIHYGLPRKWTRYKHASENVRQALGQDLPEEEVDRIIYGMWVHLFRMVAEIIQLPRKLRLYNCRDIMSFYNRDESVKSLCSGRPVMVLGGHFGNWEMAMSTFGLFGFPMGVVARDLDNPYLHAWFERFRIGTGHRLISKKGAAELMLQYLGQRSHLGLLGDQDAGRKGLFVDFFGKPASTFKSIALLAIEYRAVIVVGYARRLPDDFRNRRWAHFELGCEAVIDPLEYDGPTAVRQITEDYTKAIERLILKAPEQYFWVHRRWKSQPGQRKAQREAAKAAKAA